MNISLTAPSGQYHGSEMVINVVDGDPCNVVRIERNGQIIGEITLGILKDQATLWEEVLRARRLEVLPRVILSLAETLAGDKMIGGEDHVNKTPAAKRDAFWRGMVDGLNLKTVPHPTESMCPEITPEHSPSYHRGYDHGQAIGRIARACSAAKHRGEDFEAALKREGAS